jgi:DNA-binding PadR family transcriptional regulator
MADSDYSALTEAVYYILLSLYTPLHGYGIIQYVEEISKGRVVLAPGTLYGALSTLQDKGLIKPVNTESNSRKKEYLITKTGKQVVKEEIDRLEELIENGKKTLEGDLK